MEKKQRKSKHYTTLQHLHGMKRTDALMMIQDADLTAREKDILVSQELEKTKTIKELSFEYHVDERAIFKSKEKALKKVQYLFTTCS